MPSPGEIASGNVLERSMGQSYHHDLRWKEKAIHLTDDAKMECGIFRLDAYQVVDMLESSFPCSKSKQFHKKDRRFKNIEIEVCCKKNKKTFRIIYCEDDCIEIRETCWLIIHVKPT